MNKKHLIFNLLIYLASSYAQSLAAQEEVKPTYEQYIKAKHPTKAELDVYLNDPITWARFDPELAYTLGNSFPKEGINNTLTICTSQANGTRTSFMYKDKPCRMNAYGDSFTQSQQVNDGETWEELLAAHLGEPIRNFGMGGYSVYNAYRRMLREEQTKDSAQYVMLYMWGDDHIRSLLRARCMVYREYLAEVDKTTGCPGLYFSSTFWPHLEIDLNTGNFVEYDNILRTKESLYKMTDPEWLWKHLKTDLATQMYLFRDGKISDVDVPKLRKLAQILKYPVDLDTPFSMRENVSKLLDKYGFASTKYTLAKAKAWAEKKGKKLMVLLFDPYNVVYPILNGKMTEETRYDKEVVEYLQANGFNYFDMNLVHLKDFKRFNLSLQEYWSQYFIGHYTPAGNFLFAHALAPQVAEWLDPKPIPYSNPGQKMVGFEKYLDMKSLKK